MKRRARARARKANEPCRRRKRRVARSIARSLSVARMRPRAWAMARCWPQFAASLARRAAL
eukprot:15438876-Alexandrium_andersonii.AAC.1